MRDRVEDILSEVKRTLEPLGLESHAFLTGWYNDQVDQKFRLEYPPDTLSVVVISQPSMFELAFLPFLSSDWSSLKSLRDPLDECMLHCFGKVTDKFPGAVAFHDFQMGPFRRPKVLVQTAGHVSGSVRYYHPSDYPSLTAESVPLPGSSSTKLFPVCHHPSFGGWFALRGVIVFQGVNAPDLSRMEPPSVLSPEEAQELLFLYNTAWQDNRWRDVGRQGGSHHTYSANQVKYFDTRPADRNKVVEELLEANCNII